MDFQFQLEIVYKEPGKNGKYFETWDLRRQDLN